MLTRRAEGQKPCPALSFQNAEQGSFETKIQTLRSEGSPERKSKCCVTTTVQLRFCRRGVGRRGRGGGRGSGGTAVLRGREIAGDLTLADVENDDFVRGHAGAAFYIELNGLAGSLVLLLDGLVVSNDGHGVLWFFRLRV